MQILELFAGAGGAATGLRQAGMQSVALVEMDAAACRTLRAAGHAPVVEGDVRNIPLIQRTVGNRRVDAIWSSFPCQAWSMAGTHAAAADHRNGWPWTLAAIDAFQPSWLLAENVRGITMHKSGCGYASPHTCGGCYFFGVIMPSLQRRFWSCGYWLIDAADYGVPQHRRRVIIWAGPRDLSAPPNTHGKGALPYVSMGEALGMGGSVLGRNRLSFRRVECLNRPAPTVLASEHKGTTDAYRKTRERKMANASDALWAATGKRRLSLRQCAVLQGFEATYPFRGTVEQQYRQIGNAVPPALARAVAMAVLRA